jgi:hypothetical protein
MVPPFRRESVPVVPVIARRVPANGGTAHAEKGAASGGVESAKENAMPHKYGQKASEKVERAMHEMKRGELKSGRSGKTVKTRKQAIAIGLSEARRARGKVPAKRRRSSAP